MTVLRYGHLRSAPVVVDVGVRTEREPPTLRAAPCELLAPRRILDGLLPLRDEGTDTWLLSRLGLTRTASDQSRTSREMQNVPWSWQPSLSSCVDRGFSCPRGLWESMRHPVQLGRQLVSGNDTGRHPFRSPFMMGSCVAKVLEVLQTHFI